MASTKFVAKLASTRAKPEGTLPAATDVARDIFDAAWSLFQALRPQCLESGGRIRLVGVRVDGLTEGDDTPRQLALGEREHGWREAERAADAAATRFGGQVVRPASLCARPECPL